MSAAVYNLVIEQGATFQWEITWRDESEDVIPLSGYVARMQVRDRGTQAVILDLTIDNGRVVMDTVNNKIMLEVDASDTADLDFTSAVYDLEVESAGGVVRRLLKGKVTLDREVTRDTP